MDWLRFLRLRGVSGESAGSRPHTSEALLRSFIEYLPFAVAMFDRDMRYLAVSRRWIDTYGLEPQGLIGRSHYDVFADLPQRWKTVHERGLAGETIANDEDRFDRSDGSVQWLRWEVRPWFDATDAVGGVIIYVEDITVRKQAEAELEGQRLLLVHTGEMARVGGWVLDRATGRIEATPMLRALLGLADDRNPSNEVLLSLCDERDRQELLARIRDVEESRQTLDAEVAIRTPAGEARLVHLRAAPEFAGADLARIRWTLQDVTEHRRAESELRVQQTRYRALSEQALPDAMFIHDGAGKFIEVNQKACESVGYTRPELLGMRVHDLEAGFDVAATMSSWAALPPGETRVIFGQHRRKDGSTFPVEIHFGLMADGGSRIYISLARDISEQRLREAAFHASESRLRLAQNAARAGTWEWELATNGNFWSDEVYRLYGLQPGSRVPSYDAWVACIHPDDRQAAVAMVDDAAARGAEIAVEWRVAPSGGPTRWLLSRGQPQFGSDGRLERYIGIVLDITERRNAEQATRESERRFHDIVAASADWIWEVDRQGRFTYVSEGVLSVIGMEPGEVCGRTPFDFMPPAEAERMRREFERYAVSRLQFRDLDNVNRHQDGSLRYLQSNGTPILDEQGRLAGYRGLNRDVTASKLAELRLLESEARYRDMFEANPNPMFVFDLETLRIVAANDAALHQYGYARLAFLRLTMRDLRPPEEVPELLRLVARSASGAMRSGPERHLRSDGQEMLVEVTGQPMTIAGRRTMVVLAHDVTARERVAREMRALNANLERRVAERTAELEQANLAKSGFLANMSHELRTPLNAIIGFSEMLKDGVLGDLDENQREYVGDIFEAGTHLLSLINDVLDLSKVEAGMLDLERTPTDIADLLRSATVVVREKAIARGVRLLIDVDPDIGSAHVDGRKLKQIVFNLLSNAVKFTGRDGKVSLRARRCAREELRMCADQPGRLYGPPAIDAEQFLEISVSDTGTGIAAADLDRLFQPFVQLGRSDTQPAHGTGLGLSLVRKLAQLHGGTVGVTSQVGQGSLFVVWLPCVRGH